MAVELAKVSLWLDCFTLGAPLSFLDHHLRCGNSLIGVSVDEAKDFFEKGQLWLFGTPFEGVKMAADLMRQVGFLPDVTSRDVSESKKKYKQASDSLAPYKRILDVYTSRWFGNEPKMSGRGKTKEAYDKTKIFLQSQDARAWMQDPKKKKLSGENLEIAEIALRASAEKRFFHWELEFPEVFYGPRPGTERVIERLEGAGFDAVIGNPPYDEPSNYYSNISDNEIRFLSDFPAYAKFKNGRINLYRIFIIRSFAQLKDYGVLSFIVPLTLLADSFSKPTREWLLHNTDFQLIENFPQKDDPVRRVFFEAKLSTCIFVASLESPKCQATVRTHPGRYIELNSPSYRAKPEEWINLFSSHPVIPCISEEEWNVLNRTFSKEGWNKLSDVTEIYVGEVFDNSPNKKYLSDEPIGPLVLRGANIDRYFLRAEPSQGANRYLDKNHFLNDKKRSEKIGLLNNYRIGLQRGAAVDNWRRLIGCIIPPDEFCFDTVLLLSPKYIDLHCLLGLVNSQLWEWRFRCTSTTNHVNEYELFDYPIPPSLLDAKSSDSIKLKNLVQKVCSNELEVKRSENQKASIYLGDSSIDNLVYNLYGLSQDEIKIVEGAK
jgi:hypothetical protein